MARGAEKWAAKLSGDSRKAAIDRQKNRMCKLEKQATEALIQIEREVKQICQGTSTLLIPYYIIFGKEIYRLRRHHKDETLINEAVILETKWEARGLDANLLDAIKTFYIPAYKPPVYFRLDISLLDGPDVLV